MRSWSTHALRRTLSRAGSSGANDHPPAPHSQAGGRLTQSPPLRQGLGTLCDNDRGSWTRGEGSAYTPPGLVVSCGVGISVVSVVERWCLYPTRVVGVDWIVGIVGIGDVVSIRGVELSFVSFVPVYIR